MVIEPHRREVLDDSALNCGHGVIEGCHWIGGAQPFSLDPGEDVGQNAPLIDMPEEELAWITDEVPLIPLDGSPTPEGIPQHIVDEVSAKHTAREEANDDE